MINTSPTTTTPSTFFSTLHFTTAAPHPRLYHACANSKLILCRRHLPVIHSDPAHGRGHTPAAGPQSTPGITASGRSPKVRQTRQYERAKTYHGHKRLRQAVTFNLCRMRLTNSKRPMHGREKAACGMPFDKLHVTAGDLGLRRTCL
jgi:hypothetical protein